MQNSFISLAGEYEGDYLEGRFHGRGVYKQNDFKYDGNFLDGLYHGEGTLFLKSGRFEGNWNKGKLVDGGFIFEDGLHYSKQDEDRWKYCSNEDPRFYSEIQNDLQIGEKLSEVTSHSYGNSLPKGCYDVIEGYYDPKKLMIFSYGTNDELRMPTKEEHKWFLANCRVGK
jgi:hypothetical protein